MKVIMHLVSREVVWVKECRSWVGTILCFLSYNRASFHSGWNRVNEEGQGQYCLSLDTELLVVVLYNIYRNGMGKIETERVFSTKFSSVVRRTEQTKPHCVSFVSDVQHANLFAMVFYTTIELE